MKISLPRHAHANASGLSSRIQQYSPLIEIREISVAGVSECDECVMSVLRPTSVFTHSLAVN